MLGTKLKSPTGEDRTYYIPVTGQALCPLNTPKQLSSILGDNCLFERVFFSCLLLILELKNVLSKAKPRKGKQQVYSRKYLVFSESTQLISSVIEGCMSHETDALVLTAGWGQ